MVLDSVISNNLIRLTDYEEDTEVGVSMANVFLGGLNNLPDKSFV